MTAGNGNPTSYPHAMLNRHIFLTILFLAVCPLMQAQEYLVPLQNRPHEYVLSKSGDSTTLQLPFADDFSNYSGIPDIHRWHGQQCFVNDGYGALPPTIGMATLDALDAHGELYASASTSIFSADTLTSLFVRLDSVLSPYAHMLTPGDSVCLSFYYLPGGGYGNMWERLGDAPEEQDSLILEFYCASENRWILVWSVGGVSSDTLQAQTGTRWQYVCIPIKDSRYFNDKFQFRFRNYCSMDANPKTGIVGNSDQWNIDYILLDKGRSSTTPSFRDVAFVDRAPSMLRRYQAMPYKQFRSDEMKDTIGITITNLYNQSLTTHYGYSISDEQGNTISDYNGGYENAPVFLPNHTYQTHLAHARPPINFSYPVGDSPCTFKTIHIVTEGVAGDSHTENDTISFSQIFDNYYAYDDGVAENGYGLTANGSRMYIAYQFTLNEADTLTAIDLYFNSTRNNENIGIQFYLCIWSDDNGKPGTLLYKDTQRQRTVFQGLNQYIRYTLSLPTVVEGTIYVGIEQIGTDYINLGFDRNNDARQHIFAMTSGQWQQSILKGALMIRPCFGQSALLAINQAKHNMDVRVYPSTAHEVIHLQLQECSPEYVTLQIFDMHGRQVYQSSYTENISLTGLSQGMYLLHVIDTKHSQHITKKFIVR